MSKNMPNQAQRHPDASAQRQQGAVLIIALIMLALLSMSAATSMHQAQSTESISGSTRNTELASQAAEIALRHCRASVMKRMAIKNDDTSSDIALYSTTFTDAHISSSNSTDWANVIGKWDAPSNHVFVLPLSLMGNSTLYKRAPECMVESELPTMGETMLFVITARGFGPEVAAADAKRLRPIGTEVWLQTHLSLLITSKPSKIQALKSPTWRQLFLR
jgi:type IV pilus assembly protein PilX